MYTAHCLLDTGAGINIIRSSLVPTSWFKRIKRDKLPTLQTATKQPLSMDGFILLNLRLGDLNTRIWFGVAPHLALDIFLGTAFIDRFIRSIFPSERKVVPWHSKLVAIMTRPTPSHT